MQWRIGAVQRWNRPPALPKCGCGELSHMWKTKENAL
jgi:hypothetical protein